MIFFKTKYDLTLNEVSMLFETGNLRILCKRKYIPAYFVDQYYASFALQFSEMFNSNEVSQLLNDDILRMRITNQVHNILFPIGQGLLLCIGNPAFEEMFIKFKALYFEIFNQEFKGPADVKNITAEIKRLSAKLKEIRTPAQKVQGSGKLSFEEIITYVEAILERGIPREMFLYQFKFQYDLAVRRSKEYEKLRK